MTRRDALLQVIDALHDEITALKDNNVHGLERATATNPRFGPGASAATFAAANVPVLPSAYSFDANFDGRPDVVVAPNMLENDEDLAGLRASVRLFENTAAAGARQSISMVS